MLVALVSVLGGLLGVALLIDFTLLRGSLTELRDTLRMDIAGLRGEMQAEIGGLRTEVRKDVAELRADMRVLRGGLAGAA